MWETICDAWACWSGWNFGPNSTEYPYSEIQFQNTPPKNENCHRSWHFDFSVSEYPPQKKMKIVRDLGTWLFSFRLPPPPKLKFRQILALCHFSVSEYPPPENWNLGISWHFVTFQFQNTPPPPPENWNLGISWHFVTFQFQNTPPPENWNLGISWHFVTFQFQNTPPPPKKKHWNLGRSSQWETMCVELPHVETLSNPDNYSFPHWSNKSSIAGSAMMLTPTAQK